MGSYYGVCILSQLPITYGDEVVRIFIAEQIPWNDGDQAMGQVYPDDQWGPMLWPMTGIYSDCNHLRNLVIPQEKVFENLFKDMTGLDLEKTNSYQNYDFLKGEQKINHPWIHNEKRDDGKIGFGAILIHKKIWDFCLARPIILRFTQKNYRETGREYIDQCLDNIGKGKIFFAPMRDPYDRFPGFIYMKLVSMIENKTITKDIAYEISDQLSDMYQIQSMMNSLNKSWNPASSMGHQDCDWELLRDFGSQIAQFAQTKIEEQDDF
jgi:hypothetical protein